MRSERVAEAIRQEISSSIQNEVKDVRVGFVTVTRVEVSPDLRNANIFFSVLGTDKEKRDSTVGLGRAAGFLRRQIGQKLQLRYAPHLFFKLDTSLDHGFHVDKVLLKIRNEKKTDAPS